jgi:uncharacterized repeat protein (TIGR03803 family)
MLQSHAERFTVVPRGVRVLFLLIGPVLLLAGASQPALAQPAQSPTYKVIHDFSGTGGDGATPYGGVTLDQFGSVYGTTNLGGRYGAGSVYQISRNGSSWAFNLLHSFTGGSDGSGPGFGDLAMRNDCALFGTTGGGGSFGTTFEVRPRANLCPGSGSAWQESVIHEFGSGQDGAQPIGGATIDTAGNLFGTTSLGGAYGNGAIYGITPSGAESVIYSFTGGTDGTNPVAGVSTDTDGNLYGTTSFGGAFGAGAVYELSPSGPGWSEKVLYSFQGGSDGQNPVGGVIVNPAGDLYGTTFDGGINGGATVYQLSPFGGRWTFTTLYSFSGGYGGPYNKLTLDDTGNLYGTTNGDGANGRGSVFKLAPSHGSWNFTDLYDFSGGSLIGGSDGGTPYGAVAVDSQGNIFGTAAIGGTKNQGVVFEITP